MKSVLLLALLFSVYCDQHEKLLRNILKKNDPKVRPGINNNPLKVTVNFIPIYLNKLDEDSQSLSIFGWTKQTWMNPEESWNPESYNNITSIDVRKGEIWNPDLKIFTGYIDIKDEFGVIYHNGKTVWVTAGFFNTHCSMNFSKYPLDKQTCDYIFGSWIYNSNNLKYEAGIFKNNHYKQDLHWNLESVSSIKHEVKYDCCSPTFEDITVSFTFNRTNFVHPKHL